MFNKKIKEAVRREIDARLSKIPKPIRPPHGYNPLEVIRGGLFHWIQVPFNGVPVWCELRCLNATELEACGGLTLISVLKSEKSDKKESDKLIEIRNLQEAICKQVLNVPKYDDILKDVLKNDNVISDLRKKLDELKNSSLDGLDSKQKRQVELEIYNLELKMAFVLPNDTYNFLTNWALGGDVSDITKITREMFLAAAIKAKNFGGLPHDHISGIYTDRDKTDIDETALAIYTEYLKDKQTEKTAGGIKWFGR